MKSIQANLGSPENNTINKAGQGHGLQFVIPGQSYFNDNKEWYSPAFYVRKFKTCVRAELNTETGGLTWSLIVLGTERSKCGDVLEGEIKGFLTIDFCLPCVNKPSEMYMHYVLTASSGKFVPKKLQTLLVFIRPYTHMLCNKC